MINTKDNLYAKVLLDIAKEKKSLDTFLDESKSIISLFRNKKFAKLKKILFNLSTKKTTGEKILNSLFSKVISKEFLFFLQVLFKNNDFYLIESVLLNFNSYIDKEKGILAGKIYSIRALDSNQIRLIEKLLAKKLNKNKVLLENKVDKKIIGGVKIHFDGFTIDSSLKAQLLNYKNNLKEI